MGKISRDTFRRLVVLGTIAQFNDGVYGAKRLQKVVYLATRTAELKPFPYMRYHYGQYSEELDDIKDQLLTMGILCAEPIPTKRGLRIGDRFFPTASGNKYKLTGNADRFSNLLARIAPDLSVRISATVKDYGYLPEQKLIELVYTLPEFLGKEMEAPILASDLSEEVGVDMDDEECEELQLSLSPEFVCGATLILKGLEGTPIDFSNLPIVNVLN